MNDSIFGFFDKNLLKIFTSRDANLWADLLSEIVTINFTGLELCSKNDLMQTINISKLANKKKFDINQCYYKLTNSGWINESIINGQKHCDINPNGKSFVQQMIFLSEKRSKKLGTEVIKILGLLEIALANPTERYEALFAASELSKEFSEHIRNLYFSLQSIELNIKSILDYNKILEAFFDDYVEKFLIRDYKSLRTTSNPYRFRKQIKNTIDQILEADTLNRICISASEYHQVPKEDVLIDIKNSLHTIEKVFFSLDEYLELIDISNKNIEKRITNIIKYKDRTLGSSQLYKIIDAFKFINMANDNNLVISQNELNTRLPINYSSLYKEPSKPEDIIPNIIIKKERSLEDIKLEKELEKYREISSVTIDKISLYIKRNIKDNKSISSEDLEINSLEDFFIFCRIPSMRFIADENDVPWRVIQNKTTIMQNKWIKCRSFSVMKLDEETV